MNKVVSIILGGGRGTRLFPLTRDRSKPAVPIGGKYRLVDIPISNSLNSGIKRIFILTQFNSVSLHRHIFRGYRFDYFSGVSMDLLAAEQTPSHMDWFQGTADAVRKHMPHFHLEDDDDVVILSGDHLYRMDLQELIQFHRDKKADFVVATVPVKKSEVRHFGILQMDPKGRIISFKEKPKTVTSKDMHEGQFQASMGIYVFKAKILKDALKGNETDFGKQVIPSSTQRYKSYGYVFDGYWRDIGTIRAFYDASLDLARTKTPFDFVSQDNRIFTRPRFLPPLRIMNSKLNQCLLSDGVYLNQATIDHAVIGLRTIMQKGCKVRKSVIMGADFYEEPGKHKIPVGIGANCVIEGAIIDKNVRIGAKCKIINVAKKRNMDGPNYFIRDGVVVIPKGAIIQPGTVI